MNIYAQNITITPLAKDIVTEILSYFFFSGIAFSIFLLSMILDLDEKYTILMLRKYLSMTNLLCDF